MTALTLRDLLQAGGRAVRAALLVAALVLSVATALHHSGVAHGDMGAMDGGHAMTSGTCVGIAVAPVMVVGLLLVARRRRGEIVARRRPVRRVAGCASLAPAAWAPTARAGPGLFLRLCVDRR